MAKFLRPNKVVLVLSGRYAGKKAVIVKNTYRSQPSWCAAGPREDGWTGAPRVGIRP